MSDEKPTPPGTTAPTTAIVLLAAGAGTRFEKKFHKLRARRTESGPTLLATALSNALAAAIGPVLVVTGALDEAMLRADTDVSRLLDHALVSILHNTDWESGQASSVRCGIDAAGAMGVDAVVIGLADQPYIEPLAWRRVADGLGPITVATYDGRRGNPVKLHASVWGLLPASGDEGARVLMRSRPELVVEVPCTGSPADIDTMEDLHRWQSN